MNKGIRPVALSYFTEQNELRRQGIEPYVGKKANTLFRKTVVFYLQDQFAITEAAACTAYNTAFKTVKARSPELVEGLGRAEDKKGGRKPRVAVTAVAAAIEESLVVGDVLSSSILNGDSDVTELTAAEVEGKDLPRDDDSDLTPDLGEPQTEFMVKKKSDGTVIAEGLSFDEARALVHKAAQAKKARLYWV